MRIQPDQQRVVGFDRLSFASFPNAGDEFRDVKPLAQSGSLVTQDGKKEPAFEPSFLQLLCTTATFFSASLGSVNGDGRGETHPPHCPSLVPIRCPFPLGCTT